MSHFAMSYAGDLALKRHERAIEHVQTIHSFMLMSMISYKVDEKESRIRDKNGKIVSKWVHEKRKHG